MKGCKTLLSLIYAMTLFSISLSLWSNARGGVRSSAHVRGNGSRKWLTALSSEIMGRDKSNTPAMDDRCLFPMMKLEKRVRQALVDVLGKEKGESSATLLAVASKPEWGDYQCNAAFPIAKTLNVKPRELASKLASAIDVLGMCDTPSVAGPGFINFKLSNRFLENSIKCMSDNDARLGIPRTDFPQRVVIDFSSPNIAKEMHVGHLRSTIIGESISRVLEFLGHDVIRLNHVGDWGTQFGMLIAYLWEEMPEMQSGSSLTIGDLVDIYKKAKVKFDQDEGFRDRARSAVILLQAGDEKCISIWRKMQAISRAEYEAIYETLGVSLEERGESFYNSMLSDVLQVLKDKGLLEKSEGAQVVYLKDKSMSASATTTDCQQQPPPSLPLMVQKSDGAFLYSTTDLAAIWHRAKQEKATRILYVVDSGQSAHFSSVFEVSRRAEFVGKNVELKHVPFGLVLGEDGKKFRTRSGDTVKLKDLLTEAVRIPTEDMRRRLKDDGKEIGEEERRVAKIVGLGAVKYADLCMNRERDYRFSYEKMLSMQGNTAPYMLYAYARIQGINRKAGTQPSHDSNKIGKPICLNHPTEVMLARVLIKLPEILTNLGKDLYPNKLCDYLYTLSSAFNQFYENCSVNAAPTPELKVSRAALCRVTANAIKLGLGLLGIDTAEKI